MCALRCLPPVRFTTLRAGPRWWPCLMVSVSGPFVAGTTNSFVRFLFFFAFSEMFFPALFSHSLWIHTREVLCAPHTYYGESGRARYGFIYYVECCSSYEIQNLLVFQSNSCILVCKFFVLDVITGDPCGHISLNTKENIHSWHKLWNLSSNISDPRRGLSFTSWSNFLRRMSLTVNLLRVKWAKATLTDSVLSIFLLETSR